MGRAAWWKGEGGFETSVRARAQVALVRSYLQDVRRWVLLQPLVVDLIPEPDRPGYFRVRERIAVARVPVPHAYTARIVPHEDGVDSEVWSSPAIRLRNRMWWTSADGGTELTEAVHVEAPRPLLSFTLKTAQRAHRTMLERIASAVEALQKEQPA